MNTASRLCDFASDGQILLNQRALLDIEEHVETEEMGERELRGIGNPVQISRVISLSHQAK